MAFSLFRKQKKTGVVGNYSSWNRTVAKLEKKRRKVEAKVSLVKKKSSEKQRIESGKSYLRSKSKASQSVNKAIGGLAKSFKSGGLLRRGSQRSSVGSNVSRDVYSFDQSRLDRAIYGESKKPAKSSEGKSVTIRIR